MSKEFEKQLQDFYQDYRDENGIGWALCDAINVNDLAKDTIKFLEKFKDQRISDLEAKLTESEKNVEFYQERYSDVTTSAYGADLIAKNIQSRLEEEIRKLKQQLAEKDKSEKQFKTMYFNKCLDYEHLHEKFDDKCAEFELKEYDYKQTIFEKDQDKISFAVEQLVGVQKYISDSPVGAEQECFGREINDFIDNQIASLKKGVEQKDD